ncbi:MAG: hypothetical protein WCI75_14160, partial [candidate division NC10 bacterium]
MSADTRSEGQKFRDTLLIQGAGEVPIWCGFSLATWIRHGDALIDVVNQHPDIPVWRPAKGTNFAAMAGAANRAGEECLDN